MKILGTKPDSMIEWPGHLSYVIFIAGCNFRCPFCYVTNLVFSEKYNNLRGISEKDVLEQIKKRSKFIDAVCLTGGEPTIHIELYNFIKEIKNKVPKIKIRLETNGSKPRLIERLIHENLIDSIAMDIKNSKIKYIATSGAKVNLEDIGRAIKLIKNSNLDYEFRTTLVPSLHELEDIKQIANWLHEDNKKVKLYVLQQFRIDLPKEETINPEFMKKKNFPYYELGKIKVELEKTGYFEKIKIRGKES